MKILPTLLAVFFMALSVSRAEKSVRVFVALCDNKTQGIIPVGEKIGNGDLPDDNLYWGCTDGFGSLFKRSKDWKVLTSTSDISPSILRSMKLKHAREEVVMTAEAYRGSDIRRCIEDFEAAVESGQYDLVAFIGHNGLMDFQLPDRPKQSPTKTEAIVLCCRSDIYFGPRLQWIGGKPLLLTQQLMYPGAFILHDVLNVWIAGGTPAAMREAAGRSYAKNQKISVKAATGVFAPSLP
ncbi:MAG: hypothetical protein RL693_1662 [Verrucomicrobiota bacterium]|jgi:hypothetical protein